jgi:omega-6 fatty acid desaturase (delta-12 desaturase)
MLPHYDARSWNYVRGAASTVDRRIGFVGTHVFHHVIETHVLHHHIPSIPFYHAQEATEAMMSVMGKHYRMGPERNMWDFTKSLWRSVRWCHWVEESKPAGGQGTGVWFYRNRNQLGMPPEKMECLDATPAAIGS